MSLNRRSDLLRHRGGKPVLGHSDPRLTIGLYAQAVGSAERAAAERMGEILYLPKPTESDEENIARETAGQSIHAKTGNRSRTIAHAEPEIVKVVRGKRTVNRGSVVEVSGLEPPTSTLRTWRSTN